MTVSDSIHLMWNPVWKLWVQWMRMNEREDMRMLCWSGIGYDSENQRHTTITILIKAKRDVFDYRTKILLLMMMMIIQIIHKYAMWPLNMVKCLYNQKSQNQINSTICTCNMQDKRLSGGQCLVLFRCLCIFFLFEPTYPMSSILLKNQK